MMKRGEIMRQRIIDALAELIEELPIWEVNVSMVTRRVGVTSQLFYRHFSCLEDALLVHAVKILDEAPSFSDILDGDWPDSEAFSRFRKVVAVTADFWERYRAPMRMIGILGDFKNPGFDQFRERRGKAAAACFARIVRRQINNGILPAATLVEIAGWECVSRLQSVGLGFPQALESYGYSRDRMIDTIAISLMNSLGFSAINVLLEGDN